MNKTTIKLIDFEFGDVRTAIATAPTYTKCQGLLKGFSLATDDPDATTIDSELFDSPYETIYKGKPLVFSFDLVNFALSDLPTLFGGTYTAGTAGTSGDTFDGPATVFTSEHEWKVSFQKGIDSLILFDGESVGKIHKDEDGALAYTVKVTSKVLTLDSVNYLYRLTDRIVQA